MGWFGRKNVSAVATPAAVVEALRKVNDPEIGRDLVTLNMVRNIAVDGGKVSLDLVLTTPACPMKAQMRAAVEHACRSIAGVSSVDVRVSAEVPQHKAMTDNRRVIPGVRNVVAVASGKGGVGKSTVAANLAVSLRRAGARVGLLDADIYGPSVPTLFGLKGRRLEGDDGSIIPAEKEGVRLLSVGFMLEDDFPVIWRGPMLMKALEQFLHGAMWGELDYLIVDLPPGTGDVQISLVQMTPVAGAVVVTTPQDLALIDAKKAVRMFEKVGVPVLGVVENMSYFLCPHCAGRSEIFGHGGGRQACEAMGLRFLGEIPLQMELREASDAGTPIVSLRPESPAAKAMTAVAEATASALSMSALV